MNLVVPSPCETKPYNNRKYNIDPGQGLSIGTPGHFLEMSITDHDLLNLRNKHRDKAAFQEGLNGVVAFTVNG